MNTFPIGGEDFKDIKRAMTVFAGSVRACVPVIILEDMEEEDDEMFQVSLVGMDTVTTVTILNDDLGEK